MRTTLSLAICVSAHPLWRWGIICAGLITLLVTVGWTTARPAMALPPDFEDMLVASVVAPTALAFTPDGRLLITTQAGRLYVYQDGKLNSTPALNLSSVLCYNSERGLLGVVVDPQFSSNGYIYLYYTYNKYNSCSTRNPGSDPVNRVARFVLPSNNVVDPQNELVLIDNILSTGGNHNAGDLHFGPDGYLYISVGDGGCDYANVNSCAGSNDASRDEHMLLGKILRITRDGGIPATNPFQNPNTSARCSLAGRTDPGKKCRETFAWGLRNPFRFAFKPGASQFYINDVGQATWEEIDNGQSGADYGWNVREGHCANGSSTDCGPPPAGMTNPIYDYNHSSGCASITGGAFVPSGVWPPAYDGAYLFSDYVCGKIFRLVPKSGGGFQRTEFVTGLGGSSAVTLVFGPYQATQALYYTTYAGGGQVRRIVYTGSENNPPPLAVISASPTFGKVPLPVNFSAEGSHDPDGEPLTFDWDFGDGTMQTGTSFQVNHTYTITGVYTAKLVARDPGGRASEPATVRIDVDNSPPVLTIVSPALSHRFHVNQVITLEGSALDPEEGALPPGALTWRVILHHVDQANPGNAHTHPFFGPASGNNLSFNAPPPEDLGAAALSYLEVQLTAVDSFGLAATITQTLEPARVELSFTTQPEGLRVNVNDLVLTTPATLVSWPGYVLNLFAPLQTDAGGQGWAFAQWSDGGEQAHSITTPATMATYTATFNPKELHKFWFPFIFKSSPAVPIMN